MQQENDTSNSNKKSWRFLAGSYICLALFALVILDVGARLSYPFWSLDRYHSPNRSWIWWAANDFRRSDYRADTVLMGSSLMMAAVHGGDATFLHLPQNVAFHHRCTLLETLMQDKLAHPVHTFVFAIGGQMASDAYAIVSTLFTGPKTPKTIVYGIAPRDFMDNMLGSPASTETYRFMSKVGDLSVVDWQARHTFWERLEWACGRISFLYGHRADFVYLQNKYARALFKCFSNWRDMDTVRTPFPLRKIAMFELAEDCGPNDFFVMPYLKNNLPYADNLSEYRRRYSTFKVNLFQEQLTFLKRMLAICQDRGINVVLVNMPITKDNIAIMPPGFYHYYYRQVSEAATSHGARLIDFNQGQLFSKDCFSDSVHLNGAGGEKFLQMLSDRLVGGSQLASGKSALLR